METGARLPLQARHCSAPRPQRQPSLNPGPRAPALSQAGQGWTVACQGPEPCRSVWAPAVWAAWAQQHCGPQGTGCRFQPLHGFQAPASWGPPILLFPFLYWAWVLFARFGFLKGDTESLIFKPVFLSNRTSRAADFPEYSCGDILQLECFHSVPNTNFAFAFFFDPGSLTSVSFSSSAFGAFSRDVSKWTFSLLLVRSGTHWDMSPFPFRDLCYGPKYGLSWPMFCCLKKTVGSSVAEEGVQRTSAGSFGCSTHDDSRAGVLPACLISY